MPRPEVVVLEDAAALAARLAEIVVEVLGRAITENGRASIALAGGSTPQAAYRLLALEQYRNAVDWSKVEWFLGDERFVPVTDDRSNEMMARECLLGPLGIDESKIHGMVRTADPESSAEAYESLLAKTPLDLVLVGLGDDGHTLSLFPGEPGVFEKDRWVIAAKAPVVASDRITLTPPAVWASELVVLAAAGNAKAAPLARALTGESDWSKTPSQSVLQAHSENVMVLCDAIAAQLLNRS
jgi:6-phosphogluconolactonase